MLIPTVGSRCEAPKEVREREARRLAQQEAQRPFDLVHGPLIRAGLLGLGEQGYSGVVDDAPYRFRRLVHGCAAQRGLHLPVHRPWGSQNNNTFTGETKENN